MRFKQYLPSVCYWILRVITFYLELVFAEWFSDIADDDDDDVS